jgi:predicted  nucleic acid-binding Zn-ribbon protein
MGVSNIEQISKYSLRTEGDEDVLKIYYKREQNPLLPRSVKFKMARRTRVLKNDATQQSESIDEVSPMLRRAVGELDRIVDAQSDRQSRKQALLQELEHLESVVRHKIADLREQIEALD